MGNHKRFYVPNESISSDIVEITGGTARQISRVLRMTIDNEILIFDGSGEEYLAKISSMTKDTVKAKIINKTSIDIEPQISLTLAISLPKNDKIDSIIQRGTELGVTNFILLRSDRTVVKIDDQKAAERIERWQKIAIESTEQCGRVKVPPIKGIYQFDKFCCEIKNFQLSLIAWEEETSLGLKEALSNSIDKKQILIIIGPEGGFTESEAHLATGSGAIRVHLGKRIMRVETAALAACAAVLYELDWHI